MAFFSSNLGTFVTFPKFKILIRTLTSAQWKSWDVGSKIQFRKKSFVRARLAMELANGLEICLMTSTPNLARGNAATILRRFSFKNWKILRFCLLSSQLLRKYLSQFCAMKFQAFFCKISSTYFWILIYFDGKYFWHFYCYFRPFFKIWNWILK